MKGTLTMSFTGDLEHLPIVDVIQLLHTARKSGILRVKSRKGESQLVFKDGYIVSANHLNNRVRIGQILIDLGIITPAILDQALQAQRDAGQARKPLIVALIENGFVKEQDAYKGLEQLIEMTVVEILTWKRGTFTLEVLSSAVSDGYRYYPERMQQEINFDTQSILMDALRIFDEKMRDGELVEEDFPDDEPTGENQEETFISADDLGLTDLDRLERILPEIFTGLADVDPGKTHRLKIQMIAPDLSAVEQEELGTFLGNLSAKATDTGKPQPDTAARPLIFLTPDELLGYAVTTACEQTGISVFTTTDEEDLDPVIARSFARNRAPILVCDAPQAEDERFSAARIISLQAQQLAKYPQICAIQLAEPHDASFTLQAYDNGAKVVLPRPVRAERSSTFAAETIRFLETFRAYVETCSEEHGTRLLGKLESSMTALRALREAPAIAFALLRFVGEVFERSLTLVVRETELIAERGIGIGKDKGRDAAPVPGVRIPLTRPSLVSKVIDEGKLHYGRIDDAVMREHLFAAIGAPLHSAGLLLPLQSRGKTVSLTYGDFGGKSLQAVETEMLEILASQAALVLENSLYRKKLEKSSAA
jgi:hypothetical protein